MNSSLISIILPMYNAKKFIDMSIKSVIDQTYNNWELIIIDDFSNDGSSEIARKYSFVYNNIKYFKHIRNKGVAAARNTGIKKARVTYIAFLDSDDFWVSKKLERQIRFMEDNNYYFTYTSYEIVDEEGQKLNKIIKVPEKIDFNNSLKGNNISTFTVIININKIGFVNMPEIKHEDYAAWLNIFKKGYTAYGLKENLGYCREPHESLTSNKFKSAIWTWNIYYKYLNLSFIKSSYYFMHYILSSINKHIL